MMELNDWVILITALGGIEGLKSILKWWLNRRNESKKEAAMAIKAEADASRAEADAMKAEADTISSYAAEWKELYEKKERKVIEQDAKIDQLYTEKNEDRQRIRELMEKNAALEVEKIKLESRRCDVRGCAKRQPPSDY